MIERRSLESNGHKVGFHTCYRSSVLDTPDSNGSTPKIMTPIIAAVIDMAGGRVDEYCSDNVGYYIYVMITLYLNTLRVAWAGTGTYANSIM